MWLVFFESIVRQTARPFFQHAWPIAASDMDEDVFPALRKRCCAVHSGTGQRPDLIGINTATDGKFQQFSRPRAQALRQTGDPLPWQPGMNP